MTTGIRYSMNTVVLGDELMRYTSKFAVEYDLEQHYKLQEIYKRKSDELTFYDGFRLKDKAKKQTHKFYSIKRPGESRFSYAGDAANPEVQAIREYNYYKEALKVVEDNILAMEDFLDVYRQTRADYINELLPKVYRLPKRDTLLKLEPEIDRWLNEKHQIKNSYPVYNPAGLTVEAFDGTMMRSRAECIHYEAFYIYNVPCIFELPYETASDVLSPDFTALDVFIMKPKIFEHLGNWFHKDMVKRKKYRNESVDRWDEFMKLGFYPEVNLMLTFGAGESFFDAQAIHRKIAMLASPPPSKEAMEMLRRL